MAEPGEKKRCEIHREKTGDNGLHCGVTYFEYASKPPNRMSCVYLENNKFIKEENVTPTEGPNAEFGTETKPLVVKVKTETFENEDPLLILDQTQVKKYECAGCHEVFKSSSNINQHNIESYSKPLLCEQCKISNSGKGRCEPMYFDNGDETSRTLHPLSQKIKEVTFSCDQRSTAFKQKGSERFTCERSLKEHIKAHMDEQPFTSPVVVKNETDTRMDVTEQDDLELPELASDELNGPVSEKELCDKSEPNELEDAVKSDPLYINLEDDKLTIEESEVKPEAPNAELNNTDPEPVGTEYYIGFVSEPSETYLRPKRIRRWDPTSDKNEKASPYPISISQHHPPTSPKIFIETGDSSKTRTQTPELLQEACMPRSPLNNLKIDQVVNYGSDNDSDDSEGELPFLHCPRSERMFWDDSDVGQESPPAEQPATTAEPSLVASQPADSTGGTVYGPTDMFDFIWKPLPEPPIPWRERRDTFTESSGPVTSFSTPYEAFVSIWDKDVIDIIVTETNRYADQRIVKEMDSGTLQGRSRILKFKQTNSDEIYTYLALTIATGIVYKSNLSEYWSINNDVFDTPNFGKYMSYNRFQQLGQMLHFSNNEIDIGHLSLPEAKIQKIMPIVTHLNAKFQQLYKLNRCIALDESLAQWQGWLGINQFNKNKASAKAIKSYEVCDSTTGYLWRFQIHAEGDSHVGYKTSLVLELLKNLENKGHTVFMDSYYSSPVIARILKSRGFDCVGTVRLNRQHVPPNVKQLTKQDVEPGDVCGVTSGDVCGVTSGDVCGVTSGDVCGVTSGDVCGVTSGDVCGVTSGDVCGVTSGDVCGVTSGDVCGVTSGDVCGVTSGDVDVLVWRDRHLVGLISTYHGAQCSNRCGKTAPTLVHEYNTRMGCVDRKNQMLSRFPIERKRTRVWYKNIFRRLLNVSVANAFLLHRESPSPEHRQPHVTKQREFRKTLVKSILNLHCPKHKNLQRPPAAEKVKFCDEFLNHLPAQYPYCERQKQKLRRACVLCRKRTQTFCPGCNVPLCLGNCFREQHA